MKKYFTLILMIIVIYCINCDKNDPTKSDVRFTDLVINEFLASNHTNFSDEHGEFDDWIEIYNRGDIEVDLAGMYITDNFQYPVKHKFSENSGDSLVIQPGGFLLLWADKDTQDGAYHLNFQINADGEEIALIYSNGTTILDSLSFNTQSADTSMGRSPDGNNHWTLFSNPTPGESNQ